MQRGNALVVGLVSAAALLLIGTAAGMFADRKLWRVEEDEMLGTDKSSVFEGSRSPLLDLRVPEVIETATFALG